MKAKQNLNPDQKVINHLLDLSKKGELLVLEKELIFHLKEFRDSPFLHNLLGVTLSKQGRIKESLGHFKQAIKGADVMMGNDPDCTKWIKRQMNPFIICMANQFSE